MIKGERLRFRGPYNARGPTSTQPPDDDSGVVWTDFEPDPKGEFVEPPHMSYSDYSGSLVQRSNIEVFTAEFEAWAALEWWTRGGSHGSNGIVVRRDADSRVPEIGEFFDRLNEYPVADEEAWSELELETQEADWQEYGRDDFVRWLKNDAQNTIYLSLRNELHEKFSPLDPIFDQLKFETLNVLFGDIVSVWEEFVDALVESEVAIGNGTVLDGLFWSLAQLGSGSEIVMEGQHTHFDFDRLFRDYDGRDGVKKGAGLAEVLSFTAQMREDHALEWERLRYHFTDNAPVLRLDEGQLRVVLDALLENGGEWAPWMDALLK